MAMTKQITILHTNDIHGRLEGLARVATLVTETRANTNHPVLYFDAGDIEETNTRLSSLTKGVAMHRLLSAAGCNAAAIGNGGLLRYSQSILEQYAKAATYPLFLANLVMADGSSIAGVQSSGILEVEGVKLGIIGLTDPFDAYTSFFGLSELEIIPLVKKLADELRDRSADLIIILSHLGWQHDEPHQERFNDQHLATALQNEIDLIIGAHTHHLLEHGECVGRVWVAQTGKYAEHLGRIELEQTDGGWSVKSCSTQAILETVQPSAIILEEILKIENELEAWLAEPLCILESDLIHAPSAECAAGNLLADALRDYWKTDIGVCLGLIGFSSELKAGIVTRGNVFERVTSAANPAQTTMFGWQILKMLELGLNTEKAAEQTKHYRGAKRGMLHLSNMKRLDNSWIVGDEPLRLEQIYTVASSDAEVNFSTSLVQKDWQLSVQYHTDVIVCEVLEKYMVKHKRITPEIGRIT
jgi:2',3'-cyclic-nucleotide 2'-phosphodiesterase (5'-nucleotidase family)